MANEDIAVETKKNKRVILKNYVTGLRKESDLEVVTTESIRVKVPEGSNAVLFKNIYLSWDPYMRNRMSKKEDDPDDLPRFVPGLVRR